MRVLDLFSGIGGFSLGLERAGMDTVAFCEYDEKCRMVLSKHWPEVPQYSDIRSLTGERLEKDGITGIDVICGGFPCQPFSVAGKQKGFKDDRDLWPEMFRLITEVRPAWVIGENVAGFARMGLDRTLLNLEAEGYTAQTFIIPACGVGAFHRRDRVWIIARSEELQRYGSGEHSQQGKRQIPESGIGGSSTDVADSQRTGGGEDHIRPRSRGGSAESETLQQEDRKAHAGNTGEGGWPVAQARGSSRPGNWLPEPAVGRVANGVPGRVDRLKQLGNAVVPQIPEVIGKAIMAQQENHNE